MGVAYQIRSQFQKKLNEGACPSWAHITPTSTGLTLGPILGLCSIIGPDKNSNGAFWHQLGSNKAFHRTHKSTRNSVQSLLLFIFNWAIFIGCLFIGTLFASPMATYSNLSYQVCGLLKKYFWVEIVSFEKSHRNHINYIKISLKI